MKMQKALHLHLEEAKKNPKTNHEYIVSEKIDGWYTYIDYNKFTGWGDVTSSSGRAIPSMKHCRELYFNKLPNPIGDCRLIMEAYIPELDFYTTNGIFNRSVGGYKAHDVHFKIHDMIYLDCLAIPALHRYKNLANFLEESPATRLELLPILDVTKDRSIWLKLFDRVTYNGGEGIVLKQAKGIYYPGKRNSSLMKIKLEETFDLHCIGVYYTKGTKGNDNLNIQLKRKNGVTVDVRVGKHSDIKAIEADPYSIIDNVVEIKCMKEVEGGKLREPRFIRIRTDKNLQEID